MRVFLGMILGALLTVAAAYSYDTASGRSDVGARPMVNWDVVSQNWRDLRANLRDMGNRVHDEWVKRAG